MRKKKKTRIYKLTITAAAFLLLFLLLSFVWLEIVNQRRQISAAISTGQTTGICRLNNGMQMKFPVGFFLVDSSTPDGRFVVKPGLTMPPKKISEKLDIWTGPVNIGQVIRAVKKESSKNWRIMNIAEGAEAVLLFKLKSVNKRLNEIKTKVQKIAADESRGTRSGAYKTAWQRKKNLEQMSDRLIDSLLRLYRLTGLVEPPLPCYSVGLESRRLPRRKVKQPFPNNIPSDSGIGGAGGTDVNGGGGVDGGMGPDCNYDNICDPNENPTTCGDCMTNDGSYTGESCNYDGICDPNEDPATCSDCGDASDEYDGGLSDYPDDSGGDSSDSYYYDESGY